VNFSLQVPEVAAETGDGMRRRSAIASLIQTPSEVQEVKIKKHLQIFQDLEQTLLAVSLRILAFVSNHKDTVSKAARDLLWQRYVCGPMDAFKARFGGPELFSIKLFLILFLVDWVIDLGSILYYFGTGRWIQGTLTSLVIFGSGFGITFGFLWDRST
jgi:hypothetical protein